MGGKRKTPPPPSRSHRHTLNSHSYTQTHTHSHSHTLPCMHRAFPVPTDEFVPLLANFTRYYEANNGPAPDVSGAVATSKQDAVTREDRRLELVEVFQSIRFKLDTPEPELAYMFIVVNTTLSPFSAGSEIRPVYQSWSARVHEENQLQVNKGASLSLTVTALACACFWRWCVEEQRPL